MASIRERAKGSYEITVYDGYNINGKKLRYTKTITIDPNLTTKQKEKLLQKETYEFEQQVKSGLYLKGNIRFKDFADKWLKEYARKKLSPTTLDRYITLLDRINEAIGHIKLEDLRPNHLMNFYDNLAEKQMSNVPIRNEKGEIIGYKNLAPKTILHHHRLISSILTKAVQWQVIKENVASRVEPPKVPKHESPYLDEVQAKELIRLLENQPMQYKTAIILLIYTGLRRGELLGLEWKDIDYKAKTMDIVRSSAYVNRKGMITKDTKNLSSTRTIDLSDSSIILLKNYQKWQSEKRLAMGDQWHNTDRLFTQANGLPINADTIGQWFKKFISKTDLPKVTLHSLRHTNATLMIASGADIRSVSGRLGHSNTSTTLNIYSHFIQSRNREIADKLQQMLG